ncbi:MAG: FAD-dependent oxidoreductase [Candidatus Levybacteria bacterium]|nr:FAD-dependent oxidoreductase [Candidatus Levybacteria bacterium]
MKIAIIGGGFTGLSAQYQLLKSGHDVTIFEKDNAPGGLAMGYKEKNWEWSLEKHYHHFFTNDKTVINLCKEIGHKVLTKRPKTSAIIGDNIYQLDSPLNVLTFQKLTLSERLRMAFVLGVLKYNPFWKPFEKIEATKFLPFAMGKKVYQMIWEPLLIGKFGNFAKDISMAWFWARIKKRTTSLSYPEGGFLNLANHIVEKIKEKKGKVFFDTEVVNVIARSPAERDDEAISIKIDCRALSEAECARNDKTEGIKSFYFDKVIVTLPSFLFIKIAKDLPLDYQNKLKKLQSLAAITLILRLKEPFLKNGVYWLNICEKKWPFLAIVEHTNYMDKKYYNNEHLVYIGKYLPVDHPFMKMGKEELLKIYEPYLKKINPNFSSEAGYCSAVQLFKAPFAQPIIPVNYSKIMPPFETPLKNVYLANIEQIYPWDRGTNYAVEMGEKIAKYIEEDQISNIKNGLKVQRHKILKS